MYGPRPRLGRPPGTGYKQRLRGLSGEDAAQAAKKIFGCCDIQSFIACPIQKEVVHELVVDGVTEYNLLSPHFIFQGWQWKDLGET